MTPDSETLARTADAVATVLGAMLQTPLESRGGDLSGSVWRLDANVGGEAYAVFAFDQTGAEGLTASLSELSAAPSADDVAATLRELCIQVLVASGQQTSDVEMSGAAVETWDAASGGETRVLSGERLRTGLTVVVRTARQEVIAESGSDVERDDAPEPSQDERLSVLLDIDLPLVVRFGATDMPLKALMRLGPGSLIDLSRSPDDPVDVLVGSRVIARGEVVVVGGSYGVRILEVISQRERLSGLGV